MKTVEKTYDQLPVERDVIPIPGDIPSLGVKAGDVGLVKSLDMRNSDELVALIEIFYSTGQTRGWVEINLAPKARVLSHSAIG